MCNPNKLELNFRNESKLYISTLKQQQLWEKSQAYSNGIARYNAYLNYISLHAFSDWLTDYLGEEFSLSIDFFISEDDLLSIWELVNGSAIKIGNQRLVIIPIERGDLETRETISVPQEWVDIPNWTGDYYIAVKVDLDVDTDVCALSLCGFTTHQQLKSLAHYNQCDRTYVLPAEQLSENMRLMQVILGSKIHKEVSELPVLTHQEANKLLELLSNNSIYSPRLQIDIPFAQWAALISNHEWRQRLYQQRNFGIIDINKLEKIDSIENTNKLNKWFDNICDRGWQSLESILNASSESLAFNFRHHQLAVSNELSIAGIKLIDLGMELSNQTLALLVGLTPETDTEIAIRVQLHPASGNTYLPENAKLALLSTTGVTLQEFTSRTQDNFIQLKRFTCKRGKSFKIRVIFQEFSLTEAFTIEPIENIN
ncbi:DUF1822 family protein [Calothrix sp. UHCC 0171]|uniref:DUF1822 family protein n=1 Tax=Calothrix sp. UHCC 0171 TaxID=3110245 RepID=UPI002B1FDCD7|nr:DUF1822 family protein [Calothrix sp. UHCC 0171]MEA5573006.1 DUF1822 family protein [Calothrix sp. UHCC 0171]